jgi:PhzF family phenazine biosynthesis protein
MRTRIFQLDAFTTRRFAGNPAAVMPMREFPADEVMQAIAAENNLAETAFLVAKGDDYDLRWFTPATEVPLCGHATLASAVVVMEHLEPGRRRVVFHSKSGPLIVSRAKAGYVLDFPARPAESIPMPAGLATALGADPAEAWGNAFNYMAVFPRASDVRRLAPDMPALARLDRSGIIVTAPCDDDHDGDYDFISRYFAPAKGIPEDPVTGGAHCALAPYWTSRLGKAELHAYQASRRGGELICRVRGDRVELQGQCVFYLEGDAEIGPSLAAAG